MQGESLRNELDRMVRNDSLDSLLEDLHRKSVDIDRNMTLIEIGPVNSLSSEDYFDRT